MHIYCVDSRRVLATFVRDGYGYQKSTTLFAEPAWAEYFRPSVPIERTKKGWKKAVKSRRTSRTLDQAEHLPGYCGEECACDD